MGQRNGRLTIGEIEFPTSLGYTTIVMHRAETQRILIDPMTEKDWPAVLAIYLEGIATGNATFETAAPDWAAWDSSHLKTCRLVARSRRDVLGWAALSRVSSRCVYAGVAEVSVYVAERARGRGVGTMLLSQVVQSSEKEGLWTLQAGIFPENISSIEMHKKLGFRIVGTRERLGCMNGRWRDVMVMERRSPVAGL